MTTKTKQYTELDRTIKWEVLCVVMEEIQTDNGE